MRKSIIMAVASIFVCLQSAYPQITTNELPVSVQRGLCAIIKDKTTGTIDLPVPDIKKLLQEDSLNQEKNPNGILRTAVSIPVVIDIDEDGIWTTLADGGRLWQMEIHAEKALALDFVFSKFWLPKEGKFFLFNPSTKETIGAITSQYLLGDKNKPHRFSTGVLKGDKIILEYYQPTGEQELPIIKVEKAYYTYNIPSPNFLSTSTCSYEVNVNCSEGSNWQLEKNAVALVYYKDGYNAVWFSGSLVNNTQNNLAPLFLTADHCMGSKDATGDNDLSDWVFYWGYELENCSSTTQPDYYNKTTTGATLIANNSYSDFALLQLQQDPINKTGYIPYYLGWDASGSSGTGGVCIHHPNHDVKKISTYSCTPQTVSYNSSPYVNWGVQWDATAHGHGITEEGSSGSPLINNNHRVIGQLRGGETSCTNLTGTDKFGKLSVSWTGNGNSDYRRRLNYWLNPGGTNVQSIDGLSPYSISGPSYIIQSTQSGTYSINNLPSIYTVEWSLSDDYYNQYHLQQNSPSQNQCTITRDNLFDLMNDTLTAVIKYNGYTVLTLIKTGLYVYSGFRGQYTSGNLSGNINYTQLFYVRPNITTCVTSPSLVGATASYDNMGTTPSYFYLSPGTWTLYFDMPANNNGIPVVININDVSGGHYQLYAVPMNNKGLNLSYEDNDITITIGDGDDTSVDLTFDQSWLIEIRNATTGTLMTTKSSANRSITIPTIGWPKGIYVVKATIGKEVLTEKVMVR